MTVWVPFPKVQCNHLKGGGIGKLSRLTTITIRVERVGKEIMEEISGIPKMAKGGEGKDKIGTMAKAKVGREEEMVGMEEISREEKERVGTAERGKGGSRRAGVLIHRGLESPACQPRLTPKLLTQALYKMFR